MSKHFQDSKWHDPAHHVFEWIVGIAFMACVIAWIWTREANFAWTALFLFIIGVGSVHDEDDKKEEEKTPSNDSSNSKSESDVAW